MYCEYCEHTPCICDDEEDFYDEEWQEEQEQLALAECTCGAWVWSQKQGRFVLVADCCCGRT